MSGGAAPKVVALDEGQDRGAVMYGLTKDAEVVVGGLWFEMRAGEMLTLIGSEGEHEEFLERHPVMPLFSQGERDLFRDAHTPSPGEWAIEVEGLLRRLLEVVSAGGDCACFRAVEVAKDQLAGTPMPSCAFHSDRLWGIVTAAAEVESRLRMRAGGRG